VADHDNCHFTTTGHRSGRPHRIEIRSAAQDDTPHLLPVAIDLGHP